jgi:hypothetical protein
MTPTFIFFGIYGKRGHGKKQTVKTISIVHILQFAKLTNYKRAIK